MKELKKEKMNSQERKELREELMSNREALLATIHGKQADRIPYTIDFWWLPPGEVERKARNMGLAINYYVPCMYAYMPHVKLYSPILPGMWGVGKGFTGEVTFETPVGKVSTNVTFRDFAYAMLGNLNYEGIGSYLQGGLVKRLEDYEVLKFMAEDLEFEPCYKYIEFFKKWVGEDGLVYTFVGYHSPFTLLLIEWVGVSRLYVDLYRHPEKIEEILKILSKKYEKQYEIGANAPADFIIYGDHIDEKLLSPQHFEKYLLPEHNKFARLAREKGKITAIHCDGKLDKLKHVIAKLEHKIINAFTPPPVGNLPVEEALELWKDKILWVNYEYHFMGPEALKKHLLKFLRSIIPGERIIIDVSTERYVPPECLMMLVKIMSKVTLPLTEEKIEKIERSL